MSEDADSQRDQEKAVSCYVTKQITALVSLLSVYRAKLTTPSLAKMSVEDFMAGFGSDDEGSKVVQAPKPKKIRAKWVPNYMYYNSVSYVPLHACVGTHSTLYSLHVQNLVHVHMLVCIPLQGV